MDAKETVMHILQELSGCEEIRPADTLQGDLGMDSLSLVTLLVEMEDVLKIELKEADMNPFDLITVEDVVALAVAYCGGSYEEVC